jgi:hypothetical protein
MISLKLPDGSLFPLITQSGETKKYTLTPAIPGAHPIKIPFFTQSDETQPVFSGIVTIDGSGQELTLTISLDHQGEYTALVVDRGNGTTGTFSSQVSQTSEQSLAPDMEYEQSLQEQIALVDNYFEDPLIEEDSMELSLREDVEHNRDDHTRQMFDSEEFGDFDESENLFQLADSPRKAPALGNSDVDDDYSYDLEEDEYDLFADDEELSEEKVEQHYQLGLESDIEIPTNQVANPWMIAGIGILVLALGYLGAYGVFALIRSEAFPLLEQVFL